MRLLAQGNQVLIRQRAEAKSAGGILLPEPPNPVYEARHGVVLSIGTDVKTLELGDVVVYRGKELVKVRHGGEMLHLVPSDSVLARVVQD